MTLPIERGGPPVRMDAARLVRRLAGLVARRGVQDRVRIRQGCAGGCAGPGPNVDVAIHAHPAPGEPADNVSVGWRTYVYTLRTLDCLARVLDDNLDH